MAVPGFQAQNQGPPLRSIPQMRVQPAISSNIPFRPPRYSFHAPINQRQHHQQQYHRSVMSDSTFMPGTSSSLPNNFAPIATHVQSRPPFPTQSSYSSISTASPFSSGSSSSFPAEESPLSEPPYETMGDMEASDYAPSPNDFEFAYDSAVARGSVYPATAPGYSNVNYVPENPEMFDYPVSMSIPAVWSHDVKKQQPQGTHQLHQQLQQQLLQHHQRQQQNEQRALELAELNRLKSLFAPSVTIVDPSAQNMQPYHRAFDGLELSYPPADWDQGVPENTQSSAYPHQSNIKAEEQLGVYSPMGNYASPPFYAPSVDNHSPSPPSIDRYSRQGQGQHPFPTLYNSSGYDVGTAPANTQPQERFVDPASVSPSMNYAPLQEDPNQDQSDYDPRFMGGDRVTGQAGMSAELLKQEGEEESDRDADGEDEDAEGEEEDEDYQQEEEDDDGDGEYVLRRRSGSMSGASSGPRLRSSTRGGNKASRFKPYSSPPPAPGPPSTRPRRASTTSATSAPSPTSTIVTRRTRHTTSLPIPVPVPNLTKKSRGRRVPTVFGGAVDDVDDVGGDAGWKGARTYTCSVTGCGKLFARGEHLKRHVRSIHTHEKPHKCPYPGCGKDFSRHDNLGQHMRVHKDFSAPKDGLGLDLGLGVSVGTRLSRA